MDDEYHSWLNLDYVSEDRLEVSRANAMQAALGHNTEFSPGDTLPILFHWLYFWDVPVPEKTGFDGHAAKGRGILPPIPLPRRMWAGGHLTFLKPLRLGDRVKKTSSIVKIATKQGRSGKLIFVTLKHQLVGSEGPAIVETQDIVYREAAASRDLQSLQNLETGTLPTGNLEAESRAPENLGRNETKNIEVRIHPVPFEVSQFTPNPVLLFRYSALTMNSHRIHFDLPYACYEGYPERVVHGPLQATLLANLAEQLKGAPLDSFSFKGLAAGFVGSPMSICRDEGELWIEQNATRTMQAKAV